MKLISVISIGSAVYNLPTTNANFLDRLRETLHLTSSISDHSLDRVRRDAAGKAVATSCDINELSTNYPVQDGSWVCKGQACSVYCYDPNDSSVKLKSMNKMAKCAEINGVYQWTKFSAAKPGLDEISCSTKHKKSKYSPPTPVTEAPTEPPTEPPTEAPTEAPTQAQPSPVVQDSPVDPASPPESASSVSPTNPPYNPVRQEWNYDKDGRLMCEQTMLRPITNGSWRCKGRGALQYCSLLCTNPYLPEDQDPVIHPKMIKCTEGEWTPTSEHVVQIDHMTCDGRSNKVPKKPQNDGDALCNYIQKPEPAEDGSWVCDKKGGKCFLKCYNDYEKQKTRKTVMSCVVSTDNNGVTTKEWKIIKGKNACYNTKNCADVAIPNESSYFPGTFTCKSGKSCNFKCGDINVMSARKCIKGEWANTTGQKKNRQSLPADVACCINASKPNPPRFGSYTQCKDNKFGGSVCFLTCSNGAVLNKRLKGKVTCTGNQWVQSGFASCDQIEINAHTKEHRKNMVRSDESLGTPGMNSDGYDLYEELYGEDYYWY